MTALSNEFKLIAACCQWPDSALRAKAIQKAVGQNINWERLLLLTRRHRVPGLVWDGLQSADFAPPALVSRALEKRAKNTANKNTAMAAESLRLQALLDAAAIPNLVLKGATLAALAYGAPFIKAAWDIDLLVSPEDATHAMAALEGDGYVRTAPRGLNAAQFKTYLGLARECVFSKDRFHVEIQWRLNDNPELLKGVLLASASQLAPLGGGEALRTLGRDDLFAYLCVHGAGHGWARLKWLADLGALLAREDLEERMRLYREAEARGGGICAGQGLLLCHRLLGLELPEKLHRELENDVRIRLLVSAALLALTSGEKDRGLNQRPPARIALALSNFLMGRGRRFLAHEFRNKWVSRHDRVYIPLPRWAHFLYPIIRIPLFVWRRAFGAR